VKAVQLLTAGRYADSVTRIVVKAATEVCLGEIQELDFKRNPAVTPEQYLAMIVQKTASLMAAACASGAAVAQASPENIRRLARFGREYGIAFQIQDDLLDWTGQAGWLGKPIRADIREGHVTLPVILGLRRCRGRERGTLLRNIRTGKHSKQLRDFLERCGALDEARQMAQTHARRAQAALRPLPESPARAALLDLARFAVERNH